MTSHAPTESWSKHRVEALTDGIFAVAMTLLVIELKLPDAHGTVSQDTLVTALLHLIPKAVSWVISFFVLAIFWVAHHRLFHHLRSVDVGLLWLNLGQLSVVSLLPFSAALVGEYGALPVAQASYDVNMALLALLGLLKARHVFAHPGLASLPLDVPTYHAIRFRLGVLLFLSLVAVAAAIGLAAAGTGYIAFVPLVFLLMIPAGRLSRHRERQARRRAADNGQATTPAASGPQTPPPHPHP